MAKPRSNIPMILTVGAIYIGFALYVRYEAEIDDYWHRQIWGEGVGAEANTPVEITAEPFRLHWNERATLFRSAPALDLTLPAADFGGWLRQQHAVVKNSPEGPEEVNLFTLVPNTGSLSALAMSGWCTQEEIFRTRPCNAAGVSITIKRDVKTRDTPFFKEPS